MIASDIMTRDVVSVGPDAPVADVVALMLNHRISAVPVVQNNVVIGILSEGDLLRRAEIGTEPTRSRWIEFFASSETVAADYVRSHGRKTSEVMTRDVVTVAADTPIAEIARLLETRGIKRVPVTRDGALVGIVSRANLLQALSSRFAAATPAGPTNDSQIREAVETEIRRQGLAPLLPLGSQPASSRRARRVSIANIADRIAFARAAATRVGHTGRSTDGAVDLLGLPQVPRSLIKPGPVAKVCTQSVTGRCETDRGAPTATTDDDHHCRRASRPGRQ